MLSACPQYLYSISRLQLIIYEDVIANLLCYLRYLFAVLSYVCVLRFIVGKSAIQRVTSVTA